MWKKNVLLLIITLRAYWICIALENYKKRRSWKNRKAKKETIERKASHGVGECGKICEKWSVCVCDFFRSPKRNSFYWRYRVCMAFATIYTYSWVCNCAPSACMAQICNDGGSGAGGDGGDNNSQGIFCCSVWYNQGSDLYNNIILFITSHCVAAVVPSMAAMATVAAATTASSTTHWKQFRWAHAHCRTRREYTSIYLSSELVLAEREKILSTFIHLLMWFMLII